MQDIEYAHHPEICHVALYSPPLCFISVPGKYLSVFFPSSLTIPRMSYK